MVHDGIDSLTLTQNCIYNQIDIGFSNPASVLLPNEMKAKEPPMNKTRYVIIGLGAALFCAVLLFGAFDCERRFRHMGKNRRGDDYRRRHR